MKKQIMTQLLAWKHSDNRKPLILKGARQVGKTYELVKFAHQRYNNHHYFNFEKEGRLAALFDQDLDPSAIIQALT